VTALLPTRSVEKVWGLERLPAPFHAPAGERIGEIWFEPPEQLRELLVKYIFASEKLSVQTHPSDVQTTAMGLGRQGKEECWIILDAEPGATIAAGFREPIDADAMRMAALDGSIEDLLVWHEVRAGDFFYIPANTVHAIGGGVSLLEVQQNSDITYRLYDYGRPRELHLEQGVAVARGEPHPVECRTHVGADFTGRLVDGPYFLLDRIAGLPAEGSLSEYSGPLLVLPVEGEVRVGDATVAAGQCALADSVGELGFAADGTVFLTQSIRN
jgi:mannose-6-phosphate isomerase